MICKTERLYLRKLEQDDLVILLKYYKIQKLFMLMNIIFLIMMFRNGLIDNS